MSHVVMNEETGELCSNLACHVCKKRKIKCGRELPQCRLCEQSAQTCTYPYRALRPGPKLGSTQRSRKRRRESQLPQERKSSEYRAQSHQLSPDDDDSSRDSLLSPGHLPGSADSEKHTQRMHSLSFIIHPSHECCSPDEGQEKPSLLATGGLVNEEHLLTSTCYALSLNPGVLDGLIDNFFQTFTAYRLFHEQRFKEKLQQIESGTQINALLAAMFAFSSKGYPSTTNRDNDSRQGSKYEPANMEWSKSHFVDLAMDHIDKSLHECCDEPPPLCLLQALVLTSHWFLIQGVRGRAWRSLGSCVRLAYELNLHLVDSGRPSDFVNPDAAQWCDDEERRRVWWAIWEMDVFASVIRRFPTAIDWTQNETFLPAEDEKWFRGEPQKSCMLAPGLINRAKHLKATGNQSSKAWFIVLNSLMKEGQTISSPMGINKPGVNDQNVSRLDNFQQNGQDARDYALSNRGKDAANRVSTLHNTLRYFSMVLPATLKYRGQYLTFEAQNSRQPGASSPRHLHSSIYGIYLMSQLAKIMIYKYQVFDTCTAGLPTSPRDENAIQNSADSYAPVKSENNALTQYFKAADDVLGVLNTSSEDHFQYVNPFLANTVWLAAAVQLLHKNMLSEKSEEELVISKFEVLCTTYNQFVTYWDMSTTPRQNLVILENHLKTFAHGQEDVGSQQPLPDTTRNLPRLGEINRSTTDQPERQSKPRWIQHSLGKRISDHSELPGSCPIVSSTSPADPKQQQQPQPTSIYLNDQFNANDNRPQSTSQDCMTHQQPPYLSPALSYDPVSTNGIRMTCDRTGSVSVGQSAFDEPRKPALNYTPMYRAQYMDSGFLDSFKFMHTLHGSSDTDFSGYLGENYTGPNL